MNVRKGAQHSRRGARGGFALLIVLMMVAIAATAGTAYLMTSSVKRASTGNLARLTRARYLAESGLQHAMHLVRYCPPGASPESIGPFQADGTSDQYGMTWQLIDSSSKLYRIVAVGTVGGVGQSMTAEMRLSSSYSDLAGSLGPMAYWRLGDSGGSQATDETGSHHGDYENGTSTGADGAIAADDNTAARFDGVNDYIDLDRMDVSGSAVSLVAWFKPETFYRDDAQIISKATGTGTGHTYWMLSTAGGDRRLCFRLKTQTKGTKELKADDGDIQVGAWAFAVATYDGSTMRLYQDGVEVGCKLHSGPISEDDDVDAWIGGNPSGETKRPWHGTIDEVMIINRALSAEEIDDLYKAQARRADVELVSWKDGT